MNDNQRFETLALHAGQPVDETRSRAVPLYRTASYLFDSTEHASDLFALKKTGNIYNRIMNPTQDVLEKRLATLEKAPASLALASGTSAVFYTVLNICRSGDEIVSSKHLYGGTYTMFADILPSLGINTKFVDFKDTESIEKAITNKTKILYCEMIGNPTLEVADLQNLSAIAKKHHLPLVIDSTFATPYLCQPLEHGADIVIHSLTKWLGGHGTGIGGAVVDGGKFDWTDPKFSLYNEPDTGYHGLRFAHDLGENNNLAFILRLRLVPLRNLGACISPDNAWMFLQGIETLALRMERHCENAIKVAEYLIKHKKVAWVRYPGLVTDSAHKTASKYLKQGFGGMVVFGIKGGIKEGACFINNLQLFSHVANVGDAKSLAIHPSSTTHSQLSEQEQLSGGITPQLIRLSIGIEHIDDILFDLEQAFSKV